MPRSSQKVRPLAEQAPVESQALEILASAWLPGSDHLRVRRPGAAGQTVSRRRDAGAQQSDRQRHGRHARVVVAGAHQGGAGESAAAAGSRSGLRTWRAFRGGRRRDRPDRRHCHRLAPAGAVGREVPARGFLRRQTGPRCAVRAQRRVRRVRVRDRYIAVPAPGSQRADHAHAARPSAGSASCTPNWCRNSISHMRRFCSKSSMGRL